jgi:hypothetical protein
LPRDNRKNKNILNNHHDREPAHPETLIEILELNEQVNHQAKNLLTLALRILVDLTPAQPLVSYYLFYRYPWLFESFEKMIDKITEKNTRYWYLYMMGSFIKTFADNIVEPYPKISDLNNVLSAAGRVYGVTPIDLTPIIKEISITQKPLSTHSLIPAIQGLMVSWIKQFYNKGKGLSFDESTIELIKIYPSTHSINAIKHDIFVPKLSDDINNLPPLQRIAYQAKNMAQVLGTRESTRLYWLIHQIVVQATIQLCLHSTIIPLANYLLSFFIKHNIPLPYSNNEASKKLSSLKQQQTLQNILTLFCYAYFFYRAVTTIQRLLEIPSSARIHNLDMLAIISIKNTEFSALCTTLGVACMLFEKKFHSTISQ